jgi:hypothetical protein
MSDHRTDYKYWKLGKCGSVTSFKLLKKLGAENCQVLLIESFDCKSRDELHAREAFYINC